MEKEKVSNLGAFINVGAFHQLQEDVDMFYLILYTLCQLFVIRNY